MGRRGNVALAVAAVLELAGAVYVLTHDDAPRARTASVAVQSVPATSPSLGIAAASASRSGSGKRITVAFLGDDWTAGTGASATAKRFTTILARQLHVRERNLGVDGTGYAKAATGGGAYGSRVADLVAVHPQVVVVSGGRNDRHDNAATLADDATQLFSDLRAALPHAMLIAVAPFWGDSGAPPELVALGDAVRAGVTAAGGSYLDVSDPIHGHPKWMADDADPDDRGYAHIAAALAPRLATLLPR